MAVFLPSRYRQLPDEAYDETEEILAEIIAEIESVYGQAYDELYEKAQEYLAWFVSEDKAKRDSMGRYSSEYGYSRDEAIDDMAEDIRAAMPTMPEELKRDAQRFLSKLEQM